ncbi:PKD domain-containing protein [Tabrizicola aquatica]|uniref:PKD domain-containing protein n=1 Tax=Tabrizicola aquatica TaxID=909926 RepID=UPI0011AF69BC|nr:PKD domain-containing protein [Tabrizicola aquatica]
MTINITDCASNIGFIGIGVIDGGSTGPADFEDHGTATTRRTGDEWFLDYSHNGSTGIGGTDVFELTGADGTGNDDVLFTITITASASPITVAPGALPTLQAGTPFSQTLTSTGGTGSYTYAVAAGTVPAGTSLSQGGVLSGTPTERGAYSFAVRSTDANGISVDKGYTGSVQNPTLALLAGSGTASRGQPFSQQLAVIGGVAPYEFQIETGALPAGITLSSGGLLSGTTSDPGSSFPVTIRVTDASTGPGRYFEVEAFTLAVTNNQAPNSNAGADQTVASGAGVTLDGTGSTDPEGQTLSYTWSQTGGPGVVLSSTTAAQPTFSAPTVAFNAAPVVLTFSLIVNDGVQNSVADSVVITVSPAVNQPPTANAGADQTVASGAGVTLDARGSTDQEGQAMAFIWSQTGGPAVVLSSPVAPQPTFTAPTVAFNAAPVVLTFELVADDGFLSSVADSVTITVNPAVNQVPTANAGADQTVASGAGVTLDGTGSTDPENQTLSYTWSQSGGPAVDLSSTTAAQPTFSAPTVAFNAAPAILTFDLVVNDGVQNSVADSVTITVNPAVNQVPTANAGADQTVASGAGVTLDGTGSTDPEGQTLAYTWSQTGGPGVSLTGSTLAQPTFTAPSLPFNAPDAVLTFSLVVNDGVQDSLADDVTITVTAPVDLTAPTVTLAGLPSSVLPGAVVQVDVLFSEDVTGLAADDFAIANGTATAISGSGSSYVLTITATGGGTLSVFLPADSAIDVAANGNLASNTLEAGPGAVSETEAAIATYLQQRANALVGAQPGLIRLLQSVGGPQVAVSSKGFTYATEPGHPVWASITGQWGENGDADTRYVLGAVGTHAWLSERAILGIMLELDQMVLSEPGRTVEGTGWLIGPYVAGQVQDHPLFYEGRVLWGKTSNAVEQFGLPADSFDSERLLAQFKLQGEMMLGTTRVLPFVDGSYVSDRQESYVDGLGNTIAGQTVEQSQVALGLDLNWTLAAGNGVLEPMAGLSAVYTDSAGSGAAALIEPAFQGWRGKLKAGLRHSTGRSVFDVMTFVDGIGTPDYRDYGLTLSFSTQF